MKEVRKWKQYSVVILFIVFVMWVQQANGMEAAAAGETVRLTVGREIYYGTHSTNYFDVDGKTAYCLEPLKDTPDSGHQKPENMPHQPDPIDESFKEPYRKFYQAVAAKEHSQYHEDTQSPNFSAGLKRQNGEELNITATADNQISLQAKDKDQKPKIPDYKDFDDLVKLAKSQGQTISLGNIKSPEFKARLILACLENNVAIENMPDWSKLQGLEPETKQRLAKQKIAALRQMVHDKNQKGEYSGLSQEESDKRRKLEQARATIRTARHNNQTQNNPTYDAARAAVIARQKELKGR